MFICNNRNTCGSDRCSHRDSHTYDDPKQYGGKCSGLQCKGFGCSYSCGKPRKCINEFVEMMTISISKKNENEV